MYENLKYIFVIGIGGSNQASKAVYSALRGNVYNESDSPKMFFIEYLTKKDEEVLQKFVDKNIKSKDDFHVFTISKSGETKETLYSFERVREILSKNYENINQNITVISEKETELENIANKENFNFIEWTDHVGGRFSAFTSVHTVPLKIAGFDTDSYLRGKDELDNSDIENISNIVSNNYRDFNISIIDLFFFDYTLEDLGKWARQLIAESLGKTDEDGEKFGITPTVSIAPHDLHSMLQLYLGGPKQRFTLFVKTEQDTELGINIQENVIEAYKKYDLPHYVYNLGKINEKNIAKFMQTMMDVTKKIGEEFKINIYGQEAVEEYKKNNK